MTVKELTIVAKELGICGYSKMKKEELLIAISQAEAVKAELEHKALADKLTKEREEFKTNGGKEMKGLQKRTKEEADSLLKQLIGNLPEEKQKVRERVARPESILFKYVDNASEVINEPVESGTFIGTLHTKLVTTKAGNKISVFDKVTIPFDEIKGIAKTEAPPMQKWSPITQWVLDGKVKMVYVYCPQSKFRHDVFAYLAKMVKKGGFFMISPDFKTKHMRLYFAKTSVWAEYFQMEESKFMAIENHTKILRLFQTPTKAQCVSDKEMRIFVLPEQKDCFGAASDDGTFYTKKHFFIYKEVNEGEKGEKEFDPRDSLIQIRFSGRTQAKGLIVSDEKLFYSKSKIVLDQYQVPSNEYDIVATMDCFKLNKPEAGKVFTSNWNTLRAVGFKMNKGTSSIGGQAICLPCESIEQLMKEKGLIQNAEFFRDCCNRKPEALLKAYGLDEDNIPDDNKYLNLALCIKEGDTWRMPAFAAAFNRDAAILEQIRRNKLFKIRLANTNSYIAYSTNKLVGDIALDELEKEYYETNGKHRIFFLPSNDVWTRSQLEKYGKITFVVYPTVGPTCVFDAYPVRDERGKVKYGPAGLNCFSGRALKNCFRDGDGDKVGTVGTSIEFPPLFIDLPEEEPVDKIRDIPATLDELYEWHQKVATVIFNAAVTIGIVDLSIRYIYMVRMKKGVAVTSKEAYIMAITREQVIQSLKHLYGKHAGASTFDLNDHATLSDQLVDAFGADVVPYMNSLEPDLDVEGMVEHLILTKGAGAGRVGQAGIIQHVLNNLLPRVFDNRNEEEVNYYLRGNPFRESLKVIKGCTFKPCHSDSDIIRTQFSDAWVKYRNNFKSISKENGYDFSIMHIQKFGDNIRFFYKNESNAILNKFKRDKNTEEKRAAYLRLSRAIRMITRGWLPSGYKMQSNTSVTVEFKNMINSIGNVYSSKDAVKMEKVEGFIKGVILYLGSITYGSYSKKNYMGDVLTEVLHGKRVPQKGSNSGGVLQYFPAKLFIEVRAEIDPDNPYYSQAIKYAVGFDMKQIERDIKNDKKEQLGIDPYAGHLDEEDINDQEENMSEEV